MAFFGCSVPFSLLWPCEKLWPLILESLVEAAVNSVSMKVEVEVEVAILNLKYLA